jgi:hypothetical protein
MADAPENADDVGFISALIDELVETRNVDPPRLRDRRPNGGQMAPAGLRAAEDRGDRPVIAQMLAHLRPGASPRDLFPS